MMISQLTKCVFVEMTHPEISAPVDGGSDDVGASLQSLGQECEDWPVQRVIYFIIIIIIITGPKPAYGRQGLAGSWGQDTDKVSNFWVFLTSHFAQLGIKPTWDHS